MTPACVAFSCIVAAMAPVASDAGALTADSQAWPQTLFGRQLQFVENEFAIYANSSGIAQQLRSQLSHEFEMYDPTWAYDPLPVGAVVAIEPGDEPLPALEEWQKQHASDKRRIEWTDSDHAEHLITTNGRPYCVPGHYFRQSFAMPVPEINALEPVANLPTMAKWVCVVTTDEYWAAAIRERLSHERKQAIQVLKEVPPVLVALNALSLPIMWGMGELVIAPAYCSIDRQMLHLQRIETIQLARMAAVCSDPSVCAQHAAMFQAQIDYLWRELWRSRPLE